MPRIVQCLLVSGLLQFATVWSFAATGDLLTSFNFGVYDMVADPSRSLIYASVPSTNSIAVFNSNTLSLVTSVFIGSNPEGIALSADNSKLFVANNGSTVNAIGVLDLATLTALPSFSAPLSPVDLAMGNGGRLYASSPHGIMQFDITTGNYVTAFPVSSYIGYGALAISPDRNTLYDADYFDSPHSLQRFDVSTATGSLLQTINTAAGGSTRPVLNHSGTALVFSNGYSVSEFSSSNLNSVIGTFNVGAYPTMAAFSPDDKTLYVAKDGDPSMSVFNANTFVQTNSFSIAATATSLVVDNTGSYLFVGEGNRLQVFSTGVSPAPEPSASGLMTAVLACGAMVRRRRKAER